MVIIRALYSCKDANESNQAKLPLSTNDFYITNSTLQTMHIRLNAFPVISRLQDHDLWLEGFLNYQYSSMFWTISDTVDSKCSYFEKIR